MNTEGGSMTDVHKSALQSATHGTRWVSYSQHCAAFQIKVKLNKPMTALLVEAWHAEKVKDLLTIYKGGNSVGKFFDGKSTKMFRTDDYDNSAIALEAVCRYADDGVRQVGSHEQD